MLGKLSEKKIKKALETVIHPKSGKDIVSTGAIGDITINDGIIGITMLIDPDTAEIMEGVRKKCDEAVQKLTGVKSVRTVMTAHAAGPSLKSKAPQARKPPAPPPPQKLRGVKHIIAIASGKGGVGKSTTSTNLACAFQQLGLNVGIMDCDIYGPSIQRMMGPGNKPDFTENDRIKPVTRHNIKSISMGHLIPEDRATIWRGPMVIGAVQQLLNGVAWDIDGELDVLVVDLPPGTGDAQLTLVQTVPVDGVVIVSTPQDIALIDAKKAFDMFVQTNINILGMIENMSILSCPHCSEDIDIFGQGGAKKVAQEKNIRFLGGIPLDIRIRTQGDNGMPITIAEPDSSISQIYLSIAQNISSNMAIGSYA